MSLESSLHIGLAFQRPAAAASIAGVYFFASDTQELTLCDGTQWTLVPLTVVFGPSGANHSLGMVPDAGDTGGTTRYLREDATWVAPPSGGGGGLRYLDKLDTDVAIGSGNVYTTAVSRELPAGTWLCLGTVAFTAPNREGIQARIFDGTSSLATASRNPYYLTDGDSLTLPPVVITLAAPTTISLQGGCSAAAGVIKASIAGTWPVDTAAVATQMASVQL